MRELLRLMTADIQASTNRLISELEMQLLSVINPITHNDLNVLDETILHFQFSLGGEFTTMIDESLPELFEYRMKIGFGKPSRTNPGEFIFISKDDFAKEFDAKYQKLHQERYERSQRRNTENETD